MARTGSGFRVGCLVFGLLAAFSGSASGQFVISEFLASNQGGIADEDGERSDWIEIQNLGPAAADVGGWFLTDSPDDLDRWRFPSRELAPGGFLLVFASEKDRAGASGELHANFKLSAEPGYLALVKPDGRTIAQEFAPGYPEQFADASYGLAEAPTATSFVATGAPARVLVPTDGRLGLSWTEIGFGDASWKAGATGIGFAGDPEPGATTNLARNGTATQSTVGFGADAARAIDGNRSGNWADGSVTHTADGDPGPSWEVDLGSTSLLERIVLWNRIDCCAGRLSNFRVSVFADAEEESWSEDFFTDGIGFPPPKGGFEIPLPEGTAGRFVRIEIIGPNATGQIYLSLAEVEVFGGPPSLQSLVAADVGPDMRGINSSAYVRIGFQAADPSALLFLELRMKYDDGFVAYLNGREVARRNAPPSPSWDSAAIGPRAPGDAVIFQMVNVPAQGVLAAGPNVLAIHGLNVARDDGDFLILPVLDGISIRPSAPRYFTEPTPGALNAAAGFLGFVADTKFTVNRGFFDAPFEVGISTDTPGAVIRYTTNGTPPGSASGAVYTGPIRIAATTTLRAAAFKEGYAPTNVDTQTYLFPAQVVKQTGAGFPASWGGTAADYAMDPNVVNDPAYRDTIEDDVQSRIPTLSIVMKVDDLFGPSGIYSNTEGRGEAWERACSMELIYPDPAASPAGPGGFQTDCGIRIYGYGWRSHSATMKHAFRLLFKRKYGPAKLEYPFFPDWPVKRFDDIVLRSQGSRGWNDFRTSIEQTCYMRDAWARYSEREMGKMSTSSTYVHLYLNGLYWGLYNPVERPDAEFMEEHLGGAEEDYDALNARVGNIEVIDGSRQEWDALLALARGDVSTLGAYQRIQGSLDVVDLADYLILQFYTVNQDWVGSNGNNMRVAGSPRLGIGFKAFSWDMEYSIWNATDNVMSVLTQYDTPALLYARLKTNAEFRMLFADRARRHLELGGALTPERAADRWRALAEQIDRAVVGESARWGDRRREPPYTRNVEWVREQNRLLTSFFPRRAGIMLQQLTAAGLYPTLKAPAPSQEGGPIPPGFTLTLSAPAGSIYYTLDGPDPRLAGNLVSPDALLPDGGTVLLVSSGAPVRALVPADGSLGPDWTGIDFDDAAWIRGATGVGYELQSGYETLIGTDLSAEAYGVNASFYARVEFTVADPAEVGSLRLRMKYDDGFVAYLNGSPVASQNAPAVPAWNSSATTFNDDARAVVFENFDLPGAEKHLRAGRNVLAIHGLNQSASSNDFLVLPELSASRVADAKIVLDRTTTVRARAWLNGTWSALTEVTFVVDSSALRITELMYHPPSPPLGSPFQNEDFEFIEFQNAGDRPLNLAGIRVDGAIGFTFPDGVLGGDLPAGAFVLLVKDLEAFLSRYPGADQTVAGEYQGNLSNGGERVILSDARGEAILDFAYSDDWYPSTDGGGRSLEILNPRGEPESWSDPASWRPSAAWGGTPGEGQPPGGGRQVPGDINQDAALDISDVIGLLGHLFLGEFPVLPCSGGTLAGEGNRLLLDANGDAEVDLTDTIHLLSHLFQSGPPPALGTGCLPIPGCPSTCGK